MLSARASLDRAARVAVPLVRLDGADPALLGELMQIVGEVAAAGAFTLGGHVEGFERDFAAWCGSEHAVGVSSGTEALALALRALEVGAGDEVIVPANSFIATAEAVSAVGATPLLVDVEESTGLLSAEIVAGALTARVRCVIPVHLYGRPVEMGPLLEVCRRAGVAVLEDACQAHGAVYHGARAGTLGDAGCFSFYPTKNLGAWGDAGAVVTASAELAERVRLLRSHGELARYEHRVIGSTARMDGLQAAVLRHKLTLLEHWNAQRRTAAATLRSRLQGLDGLQLPPVPAAEGDHVFHLFVVRTDARDALRAHLQQCGVASAVHYPVPIHLTEAYGGLGLGPGSLPVCERLAERSCSLPLFPGITSEEIEQIAAAVTSFVQARGGV
jgi:dTDP-3-amino-3,4,6-trideoxy-alpha-D-glucose transaminase